MRDMQVVHLIARWAWQLLRVIYKDHPLIANLKRTRLSKEVNR
jgi:hypothetical protein